MQLIQGDPPLVQICPDLQTLLQADIGDHVDRVQLGNVGQGGFLAVAAHDIARIDQVPTHLTVERRPDFGIAQVQLSQCHLRLSRQDIRLGTVLFEVPVIDINLRRCIPLEQSCVAADLGPGVEQRRLLQLKLRLSLLQLRLGPILLNRGEKITFLDQRSISEMQLLQKADDTRDQLDLVDRGGIAGDLEIVADGLDLGLHHRDRWRRLARELRLGRDHRCGRRRWRRCRTGFGRGGRG